MRGYRQGCTGVEQRSCKRRQRDAVQRRAGIFIGASVQEVVVLRAAAHIEDVDEIAVASVVSDERRACARERLAAFSGASKTRIFSPGTVSTAQTGIKPLPPATGSGRYGVSVFLSRP